MDIIEQIGSYAGLAAIVGLAVMSALYFSQARDVKRLREWAGRAPERTDAVVASQAPRVVAKPVPKPPGAQAPATPAPVTQAQPAAAGGSPPPASVPQAQPQPAAAAGPAPQTAGAQTVAAQAAGTGAAPAVATGPAAATPAAARAAGSTSVDEPPAPPAESANGTDEHAVVSQDTVVHPPPAGQDDDVGDGESVEFDDVEAPDDSSEALAAGDEETTAIPDGEESEEPADAEDAEDAEVPAGVEGAAAAAVEGAGTETAAPDSDEAERDEPAEPSGLPNPETFHEGDDVERPAAASPPVPPRRPTIPIGGTARPEPREPRTPILPPYSQSRPGAAPPEPPREGLFSSRRRALLVLGGTVLGIAVLAFGVQQLTGEDDGGSTQSKSSNAQTQQSDDQPARKRQAAIDPSKVTVAVLNGTTVPGLARQIGDTIEQQGFQLGTVTNFIDQQRAESVVLYAPGAEREAADVGRRLKIAQREAIDAESQGQAGDATVVVVAGADKTQ